MKRFFAATSAILLFGLTAHGSNGSSGNNSASNQAGTNQIDSLADNDGLVEKSRLIAPSNKIEAVQKRQVDLNNRLELGLSYGPSYGGEAYLNTQNLGVGLDYHIIPRLSVGARYYHAYNQLTSVGQDAFNAAQSAFNGGNTNYRIPAIDYPMDSYLGVVNWSVTYGKISLFDSVVQFDVYLLGGGGEISMSSGPTPTYTAGGGMAFWWTQHLSFRVEGRYQTYNETTYEGTQRLDLGAMTFGIGMLL